jgi:hypothetical protein
MTTVAIAVAAVLLLAAVYSGSERLSGFGFGWGEPNDGCELTEVPAQDGEVMVRAVCRWDDVPAERLHALLRDPSIHGQYFSNLGESTIVAERGDVLLVHQLHQASGMSDREIVVEWRVEPVHGGYKYHWQKSSDQSANSGKNVEVEVSTGYWEVVDEGNGAQLRYEVRYLPGGNIPAFLVRMFQSSGMRAVLVELRDTAESDTVLVRAD